ncbi:Arc family DNA-binding protein [Ensifer sp. PDNC004]|uniref:Arc family DNA-binding protein n=1 Tax=Ensifer sp. PDNC004 TaxID=2811423 RepID=UPI0019666133|nr:Arc family DNA-binding protein [Ensifer sp. PDNC004]
MEKIKRSSLTLRLPVSMRDWLAQKARENFTSLNDEIIRLIRECQENEKGEATAS